MNDSSSSCKQLCFPPTGDCAPHKSRTTLGGERIRWSTRPRNYPLATCAICLYRLGFGSRTISRFTIIPSTSFRNMIKSSPFYSRTRNARSNNGALAIKNMVKSSMLRRNPNGLSKSELRNRWRKSNKPRAVINRIAERVRARLGKQLRKLKANKPCNTLELVGCSWDDLKKHLENQFAKGMSWANHGRLWHIDHQIPCTKFDLTKEEEVRRCFHFTNLQPLWARENLQKYNKITEPQQSLLLNAQN